MTQKALFFYTDGFTGDVNDGAAPYTESEFRDYNRAVLAGNEADAGVLSGVDNELAVSGSSSPLAVATGRAQVYGFHYFNDATVNPTVTTPAVGDTGGRVVVRVNLTAANNPPLESQARVLVVLNTDGNAAIPAMNQTADTTWDIPLATFVIDTSGDIWTDSSKSVAGVSDARVFAISPLAGMVKLRTFAGDGSTGVCTFDNIQQNLSGLLVVGRLRGDNAGTAALAVMNFNGDAGNNYSFALTEGANSALSYSGLFGVTQINMGYVSGGLAAAGMSDQIQALVFGYAQGVLNKSVEFSTSRQGDGTSGANGIAMYSGRGWWDNTDAITRIDIEIQGSNFDTGSEITLYGMR
jgi:hypothetical protein